MSSRATASLAKRSVLPESDRAKPNRVGILGGTFDPIHLGHLLLAEEARLALSLDSVVFIPAGRPWRKAEREVSRPEDRLTMVRLAIAGNPAFSVSRAEIDREGPTYTVDTIDALRDAWGPEPALWFILGADTLLDLPNWKQPERILEQARLAVAGRGSLRLEDMARMEAQLPTISACIDVVPLPRIEISSSELRRRLSLGLSARYWLPRSVAEYAREHNLYRRLPAEAGATPIE